MRYLSKSNVRDIKNFYMGELLDTFSTKSESTMKVFFYKHLTEIDLILTNLVKSNKELSKITLLDVGAGLGINCIILKKFFFINCTVIDRLDEFDEIHNRAIGDDTSLKERLYNFGIEVICSDFIKNNFDDLNKKYDCVTCFSVIEHFYFSPKKFLNNFHKFCKKNALIFISTPNQLHLLNRIRALFGINIWENFDYYYNSDTYFGHVREFTSSEMIIIGHKVKDLDYVKLDYSNFPLYSNNSMNYFKKNIFFKIFGLMYELLCLINKNFKFHLTLILNKK